MEYILSILFLLSFGGIGVFLLIRSLRLRRKGIFAIGTVAQIKKTGRSYPTTVQFTTIKGEEIQISGMTVSIPVSILRIGNSVPLLYDPDNPKSAVEYNPLTMWFLPLGFIGASILALYIMIFQL
jgi:hypothetical protein